MIVYIIKMTACALLLYAIYALLFEKENMHRFKRIYLLGSLVFSMIAPFVALPVNILQTPENMLFYAGWENGTVTETRQSLVAETTVQNQETSPQAASINYFLALLSVYAFVSLILLLRLLRNGFQMITLGRKYACVDYRCAKIALMNEKIVPHSFGRYIFINREDYDSGRIPDEILLHEWAHVRQRHTYDIVFIELLIAFGWFNPVFYLFRNKIRQNHEFLADDAVVGKNIEHVPIYQKILINHIPQKINLNYISNFNFLITKKRIVMMTKEKSKKRAWCRSLALIPVLSVAICAFSSKNIAQNDPMLPNGSVVNPFTDDGQMITPGKGVSQKLLTEYQEIDVAILEIIALYLPDSVIFKPVEGKEVKILEVSLISQTDTVRAREIGAIATATGTGTVRKTSTVSTTSTAPKTTTVSQPVVVVAESDSSITFTSTGVVRKTSTVSTTSAAPKTTTASQKDNAQTYTDINIKTLKYIARKFNPPVNFEPQKIKIVVDGNVMFYDIVQAKWE